LPFWLFYFILFCFALRSFFLLFASLFFFFDKIDRVFTANQKNKKTKKQKNKKKQKKTKNQKQKTKNKKQKNKKCALEKCGFLEKKKKKKK